MILKQHIISGKIILVVCDDEILGKKFEEGRKQLDFTTDFFKGNKKTEEETKQLMKRSHYLNLNGEKTVAIGIELKLVDKKNIIWISNIPHAECVVVTE